jgi:hypothetical protein
MIIDIIDWKLTALDGLSFNLENIIKDWVKLSKKTVLSITCMDTVGKFLPVRFDSNLPIKI